MNNVEKAKDFLKLNLFFLIVGAVCLVYVVRGLVNVVETGKTVGEIFADGGLAALFGFFISKMLSLQGIAKGENNPSFVQTVKLHSKSVEAISDRIYLLDAWCDEKNKEALKMERSKILSYQGITYQEFENGLFKLITEDGEKFVIEEKLPKEKKKAVKRARKLKLTPLSSASLTSDGGKNDDPYYMGQDKRAFEYKRDGKQLISKTVCGVIFGYYGVTLITDFSIADLIWTAVQVAIFITMGMISYLQGYFFIVDEYRHRIIKKIDNLQKFENQTRNKGGNNERVDKMVQEQNGIDVE